MAIYAEAVEQVLCDLLQSDEAEEMVDDVMELNGDLKMRVHTYQDVGMLTYDRGLVLRINGAEFQITVVQSKGGN